MMRAAAIGPEKSETAPTGICYECGASLVRKGATFCPGQGSKASPCKVAFHNRMTVRGRVLAPYVIAWIAGRGGGHGGTNPIAAKAMREITSIARDFIDEDKAAGRRPVLEYVDGLFASGYLHMDRKRGPKRKGPPASPPHPAPEGQPR